jgi:hypothetical protein
MAMSRRLPLLGPGAMLVSLMAGCAADAGRLVAEPPEPTVPATKTAPNVYPESDPLADPSRVTRINYSPMLISDPLPSPAPEIAVTSEEALAIARRGQVLSSDMQPGTPTATLRMVTVGPPEDHPAARPAWVLTWRNSKPVVHGPVTLSAERRAELIANLNCVFVVVVDAGSGSAEYAAQFCR